MTSPLLMIPGPIEVSPAVVEAFGGPPRSHLSPAFIEAHGRALERMRDVWCADPDAQPFVVPGGGTLAMEMAVANLVGYGDDVVVVDTGYFGDRFAEMVMRYAGGVHRVLPDVGEAPTLERVAQYLDDARASVLLATHVDTSTGVRVDAEGIAALCRERGVVSVFDGVCATAAERFEMTDWGADVYLTGSQKAIGLPPGLALMVVSPRALARREAHRPPPIALDWLQWLPIMQAYEARRPSYFGTPATNHVRALDVSLGEILADGMAARFEAHARSAAALRAAWAALGLALLPTSVDHAANTLSALRYPEGVDASLLGRIADAGVLVAGGLHPQVKTETFRVGHMGFSVTQPEHLRRTVRAVAAGLGADADAALAAFDGVFGGVFGGAGGA